MKDILYYSKQMNIPLSDNQISQLNTYMNMVIERNKVMNLTAITEPDEFQLKHFADSLSILTTDYIKSESNMIDVGTGAGFPSLPIKIARPDIKLTLLDSLNKRIRFLDQVVDELSLKDVETIHARAEEGGRNPKLRDHFDIAVSRAVADLRVLTEYCLPYVKVGGVFISYKSDNIDEELSLSENAISRLGGKLEETISFTLADSDINRRFVIIRKVKPTPKAFPRKPGSAKKEPL
ncbi:MAG: 16S rRNA (guanine(527)-N(7))-methyltransferase RsmG [Eubacterium sp.]|nr:16S rRNA (guanine(527)-N(7))-methyltransferase RsmG [Eubacterium sp.]